MFTLFISNEAENNRALPYFLRLLLGRIHPVFSKRKRESLNEYITHYLQQITTGARQTDQGHNYATSTVKSVRYALHQFIIFQESVGRKYDFQDINMDFYYSYTSFLKGKGLSINSVGKCIRDLKVILHAAEIEGLNKNAGWREKKFKGTRVDVDSIYLTLDDLNRIMNVDLSELGSGYEKARDIFMIGVWTAQRVSDYSNIDKTAFNTLIRDNDKQEITYLNIRQKKTGVKVAIPCNTAMKAILKKYDYQLPHLSDKVINRDIKVIARIAGLTETIEIETTKGGVSKKERIPKWRLVHSHTARRTGATLMYLAGVDLYDIMKITGHTTPAMLKKYIKADSLEIVEKLTEKYDYFR